MSEYELMKAAANDASFDFQQMMEDVQKGENCDTL